MRRRVLAFLVGLSLLFPSLLFAQALPYGGIVPAAPLLVCPNGTLPLFGTFTMASAGDIQAIAASSGKKVYIYGYEIYTLAATNLSFTEGTGTNCATGKTTRVNIFSNGGTTTTVHSPTFLLNAPIPTSTAGDALCVTGSASTTVSGYLMACQY